MNEQEFDILDHPEDDSGSYNPENHLASRGNRFINALVDGFILNIVNQFVQFFYMPDGLDPLDFDSGLFIKIFGFSYALQFVFYVAFETMTGKTPSKYLTKTRVVMEDGSKPEFGQIAIRSLCRFIPFDAFSFLGSIPKGWHDTISKTRVVNDSPEVDMIWAGDNFQQDSF